MEMVSVYLQHFCQGKKVTLGICFTLVKQISEETFPRLLCHSGFTKNGSGRSANSAERGNLMEGKPRAGALSSKELLRWSPGDMVREECH